MSLSGILKSCSKNTAAISVIKSDKAYACVEGTAVRARGIKEPDFILFWDRTLCSPAHWKRRI